MKRTKQMLSLFVAAVMLLSLAACGPTESAAPTPAAASPTPVQTAAAPGLYTPGAYTATAKGHNGDLTLSVTFSENAIDAVDVGEHQETPGIGDSAIDSIPGKIVSGQTLSVEAVSGATYTSKAILAAVEDCVAQAGGDPEALKGAASGEPQAVNQQEELTTDVLVIGGGGSGMAAVLEANNAGADVILLEWMSFLGGDTGRAGGGIEAAGTRFQEANGISDKPEDFAAFIRSRGVTYRNPNLLTVMTEQSVDAVEFLAALGSDMSMQVAGHGSPVARAHRPAEGSAGQNIVQPMIAEIEKRNIPVYLNTRGLELIRKDGAVVGAKATNEADGIDYVIHAKSVVIATGNFASNNEMVAQYDARLKGLGTNSSPGSQGDGILMATAVGADLENMEIMRVRPNLPSGVSNAIAVSQDGVRFMDETNTSDTIFVPGEDRHVTVNENRTEKYYWYVMDNAAKLAGEAKMEKYLVEGDYFSANTLEELAGQIGVPADALTAAVETWNASVAAGSDEAFGRSSAMDAPISEGPFWAVRVTPNVHTTAGGIRINEAAQVLDKSEQPIPGLYAAGEVTGGVHDGVSAVCGAIVYGRIAGTSAGPYAES